MKRHLIVTVALFLLLCGDASVAMGQTTADLPMSFAQALDRLTHENRSLQIAGKQIEAARSERQELRSAWYPSVQGAGAYVRLSEKVEVRQNLSALTDPAKELVQQLIPGDELITGFLDEIGTQTLAFPLAPKQLTSVGLTAEWILFAGGKRIQASKIGDALVEMAREAHRQTDATQRTVLAETYFGLRLAQEAVSVRQQTVEGLRRHYDDALKLEAAGMADKAVRLFAQVSLEEAERALAASRREVGVLQSALRVLLLLPDSVTLLPTTSLFVDSRIPDRSFFTQRVEIENSSLRQLRIQKEINNSRLRIEQSGYLPDVALFGKQTLYSHGVQSNLVPRAMIGVGFTWNLFDGLGREQRIRQAKLNRQTLTIGEAKTREDLSVAVEQLYTRLQTAQDNARTLDTNIALNEELLRIRRKSFAEGMATGTEVVDAENLLSAARLARLAACYDFDVTLMRLLALCGSAEEFPVR